MQPQLGQTIDFTLPDQNGNEVSIKDFRGKRVVLFFYPKADTPGCTVEACAFQASEAQFAKVQSAGVQVIGLSRDTVKAQKKFADKFGLQFPLLADADQKVVNSFDLVKPKTMYGKLVSGVERTTFVIAPDGKLEHIWSKVKPEGHAEEVLEYLRGKNE